MDSFWTVFWLERDLSRAAALTWYCCSRSAPICSVTVRHRGGCGRLWVCFLLLVPFVSGLAYVIVKSDGMAERSRIASRSTPELRGHGSTFLTTLDFSCIGPIPSTLQSMSWSPTPLTRRMLRTFVPDLMPVGLPLTLSVLITVTVSPSVSTLPTASGHDRAIVFAAASSVDHSCAHIRGRPGARPSRR